MHQAVDFGRVFVDAVITGISIGVTMGIGSACASIGNFYSRAAVSALAHGVFQGGLSAAQGGKFWAGFAAGALSSIAASFWQGGNSFRHFDSVNVDVVTSVHAGIGSGTGAIGTLAFSAIMGGAGSAIGGGNFWNGAVTGLIVSGFNHLMHDGIDPPGKKEPSPFMKKLYNSWFCENQYFASDSGLRVGTYIDFTPFKKVFGIKIGEYRESVLNADYYGNKGNLNNNGNHFFEVAASYYVGASFKYNLGQNRFESGSVSFCGISFEYSVQSSYKSQFYFGLDTGVSIGLGIGGFANLKGGWRFDW